MSTTLGEPISALTPVATSLLTDYVPTVQTGQTMRATVQQITANCIQLAGNNPPLTGPFVIGSGGINVTGQSYFQGGGLTLDNGQWIKWKNTSGAVKNIIAVDFNNNTDISDAGGGVVTIGNNLWIGGKGIYYNGLGGNHTIGFTWDGSWINHWVDGSRQGQLATISYVQNNFISDSYANSTFATYGWVNANFLPKSNPSVSGNIYYPSYGGHGHAFSWDGSWLYGFVDGTNIGSLATTTWVGNNYATASWVNTNFATYSWANTYLLPLAGGTITGNLSVNGTFNVGGPTNHTGVVNANGGLTVNNAALTCNTTLYAEAGGVCAGQGWFYQQGGLSSANIAFGWDGRLQVWVNGSLVGHLVPA